MKHEDVMVVPAADLAPLIAGRSFDLIREDAATILEVIKSRHSFIAREIAEQSPEFRQIIPYVLIRHLSRFFLLTRTSKQTEARLHHKLSLGIGGHINPDTPTILGGLKKELEEEVEIRAPYELQLLGIINDESTDVGKVHLGVAYALEVPTPEVAVRETEKMSGRWAEHSELAGVRERMETWSQIVYDKAIA